MFEVLLVPPWTNKEKHLYFHYFNIIQDLRKFLTHHFVKSGYTGVTERNRGVFITQVIFALSHFQRMNLLSSSTPQNYFSNVICFHLSHTELGPLQCAQSNKATEISTNI